MVWLRKDRPGAAEILWDRPTGWPWRWRSRGKIWNARASESIATVSTCSSGQSSADLEKMNWTANLKGKVAA